MPALVAANTETWQRVWPDVEADYLLGGRGGDEVGRDAWRETLAACGVQHPSIVDRAVAIWCRQERAALRLFSDALPVLDALRTAGIRVGMVTNGAATVQRNKLATLGIVDRFDPLVISSEVGVQKPDPAVFEITLRAAQVQAADTWYVGDNLWHDVPGALTAGIRAFWLDRCGVALQPDWPQPDAVIGSLADLVANAPAPQEPR